MFSDADIQELSRQFVCVKVDPRESADAREHKRTGYVPEVVFLDSSQNYLASLEQRSVSGTRDTMKRVLAIPRR